MLSLPPTLGISFRISHTILVICSATESSGQLLSYFLLLLLPFLRLVQSSSEYEARANSTGPAAASYRPGDEYTILLPRIPPL
eukprot:751540-Hanusia_phi.AAC.5